MAVAGCCCCWLVPPLSDSECRSFAMAAQCVPLLIVHRYRPATRSGWSIPASYRAWSSCPVQQHPNRGSQWSVALSRSRRGTRLMFLHC
uniref:Putative secreted protein n=1 Tax=Anopheles darlingi TaxID=43151 RepID=A0A2M4DNY9_ANODA